jgi:predicted enzyme related to lactoylglutathione lyase
LSFDADISSFQLGAWDTDSLFLLTVENWRDAATPSCFGMLVDDVDDVDAVHARVIGAGTSAVQPPEDFAWKPRSSIIDDPSGNRIQLCQA